MGNGLVANQVAAGAAKSVRGRPSSGPEEDSSVRSRLGPHLTDTNPSHSHTVTGIRS